MDKNYPLLSSNNILKEIKTFSIYELEQLCEEIRTKLIDTVSKTGGHLSSNLGVVELTVMLHRMFNSPYDKIIFDVGHQCYTHKLLTGRLENFHTLRQENGISGFPKPNESKHDYFIAGHSSTSISVACGVVAANSIKGIDNKVIAVIGDGAFTNGMVYEGINNASNLKDKHNLIVILNDNEISISKNIGSVSQYLNKARTKNSYLKFKKISKTFLQKTPLVGNSILKSMSGFRDRLKSRVLKTTLFEDFGFFYIGPIDGHNMKNLEDALDLAKEVKDKPVLIQIKTVKGKGFLKAEENPGAFHGVSNIDLENPKAALPSDDSYSAVFGKHLTKLAKKDNSICAITAAMKYATGMNYFNHKFKDRFFDVGINEEHGITFASSLAESGMKPVFAVYSTFLQRGYDQILHDGAISNANIILGVDRAGIVGDDGETHQGVFDVAFLSSIPNTHIFSPYSYKELEKTLEHVLYNVIGVKAIRYPRGSYTRINNTDFTENFSMPEDYNDYTYFSDEKLSNNILVITYGREFYQVANAYNKDFDILKLNNLLKISKKIMNLCKKYSKIYFYEEGIKQGGLGQIYGSHLIESGYVGEYIHKAIDNTFLPQSTIDSALIKLKLDYKSIEKEILSAKVPEHV